MTEIINGKTRDTAIVIPVHKSRPSKNELMSFKKCSQVLKDYPIILVTVKSVDLSAYQKIFSGFRVEIFDDHCLGSIAAYNKLLLSKPFYERFIAYKYILIYQLDALVFKDELTYWRRKNYDYIGAPWMSFPLQIFFSVARHVSLKEAFKVFSQNMLKNPVGNGGLSLRKVQSCIRAIGENQELLSKWNANEDFFWSYYATIDGRPLKKPPKEEAVNFAVETSPVKAFKYLRSDLPFGVHDWETYNKDFWRRLFRKHNYLEEYSV